MKVKINLTDNIKIILYYSIEILHATYKFFCNLYIIAF